MTEEQIKERIVDLEESLLTSSDLKYSNQWDIYVDDYKKYTLIPRLKSYLSVA